MSMSKKSNPIKIDVLAALDGRIYQCQATIEPQHTTVAQAIEESGIYEQCGRLDLNQIGLASYGRILKPEDVLGEWDRVELIELLEQDPTVTRRLKGRRAKT